MPFTSIGMAAMAADGYQPVLAFDTDDPEFARGVEVGRLWEQLRNEPDAFVQEIHATNAEMVLRMGEATGRTVAAEEMDGDVWMLLKVDRA